MYILYAITIEIKCPYHTVTTVCLNARNDSFIYDKVAKKTKWETIKRRKTYQDHHPQKRRPSAHPSLSSSPKQTIITSHAI